MTAKYYEGGGQWKYYVICPYLYNMNLLRFVEEDSWLIAKVEELSQPQLNLNSTQKLGLTSK